MSTVLESLKLYFESNSREQIEKDWAECDKFKKVGPTVDEFIHRTQSLARNEMLFSVRDFVLSTSKKIENPKFASDFLF